MENIDTSVLGMQTYNGEDIKAIREKLGKEIKPEMKNRLHIVSLLCYFFDFFLKSQNIIADTYEDLGRSDIASKSLRNARYLISFYNKFDEKYELSPIEMFYFRLVQFEEIGNIKDILFINNIEIKSNYDVPSDMIEEMKMFVYEKVSYDEIDTFIDKNLKEFAPYVFLKRNVDHNDLKKLRHNKSKVKKGLEYFSRTNFTIDTDSVLDKLHSEIDFNNLEESSYYQSDLQESIEHFCRTNMTIDVPSVFNKLFIVSAYQAILLDKKDEIFEYKFWGYRKFMNTIRVQAALKNEQPPVDALKAYWTRKIIDHYYANIGKYELRCELRKLEDFSDKFLIELISTCINPSDMEYTLEFYIHESVPKILHNIKNLAGGLIATKAMKILEPYFSLLRFEDYFD